MVQHAHGENLEIERSLDKAPEKRQTTKHCPGCCTAREELPVESFPHNRARADRDGLGSYCRVCTAAQNRAWREKNAAKVKAYYSTVTKPKRRARYHADSAYRLRQLGYSRI
jgi:hypothetical protein